MSSHLNNVSFNRRHIFGPDREDEFAESPTPSPLVVDDPPPDSQHRNTLTQQPQYPDTPAPHHPMLLYSSARVPRQWGTSVPQQPTTPEPQQSITPETQQSTTPEPGRSTTPDPRQSTTSLLYQSASSSPQQSTTSLVYQSAMQQPTAPPPLHSTILSPQILTTDPASGLSSPISTQERCSIRLCIVSQGSHNRQHRINLVRHQDKLGGKSTDDKQLFHDIRNAYNHELRTLRQRYLSLRGLKYIAVLEYTERSTPARVEMDVFTESEIIYAFNHPDKITTDKKWVDWVFKLKSNPKEKFALEFVEGWKGEKILVLGAIPWFGSCFTAIIWSIYGDIQVAVAVASFILTASGSILALLAILSSLDG